MGYKMLTGTGGELPKSGASTPEKGNNSRLGGPYSLDEILEILGLTKNNNSHQDTQQPSKDDD